jgi:hypothetical protein
MDEDQELVKNYLTKVEANLVNRRTNENVSLF